MANQNAKTDENFKGVLLATSSSTSETRRVLVDETTGYLLVSGSLTVGGTADNSAFTAGTSTGNTILGFYHSTIDTVTDGSTAAIGMTSKRAMFVNLQNASGTEIGTASTPIQVSIANTGANATAIKVDNSAVTQPVSGTVTANVASVGTIASTAPSSADLIGGIDGFTGVLRGFASQTGQGDANNGNGFFPNAMWQYNGSGWDRVRGDTTNGLWVNIKNSTTLATTTTDGTNTANILKSDGTAAGQNAQLTGGAYLPVSFTTTTAQAVGSTDVGNYRYVSVHITSQGTSSTITFQTSNDNTNWVSQILQSSTKSGSSGNAQSSATSSGIIMYGPVLGRYFRLNVTGISAGTTAGTMYFSSSPFSPLAIGANVNVANSPVVSAQQNGTWTVQPGNTANTTAWKVDGSAVTQPVSGTVSITANSAVNVAQINAVTPLMGNGTTGTGSQRVTIASDNSAVSGLGAGATGSSVPANAVYKGVLAKTSLPSAATDGNLTGAMSDKFGRQVALLGTIRDLVGTQTTTISASTSETTIVTAAASTFNDLMMLIVSNTSSATNTRIDFRDTTAGSVLFSLQSNGGQPPIGFSLGGASIPQTSVNTNWTAQCATSTTDIRIYAVWQKNK